MSQLRGSLYMRAEALGSVVQACVAESDRFGLPAATASWVREEVEAIALAAWDDGYAEATRAVSSSISLPR